MSQFPTLYYFPSNLYDPAHQIITNFTESISNTVLSVNFQYFFEPLQTAFVEKDLKNQAIYLQEKLQQLHKDLNKHRKIHWSLEQDQLLQRLVEVQKLDWREIPRYFKDRTHNMCYSRYRRISICGKDKSWTKSDQNLVKMYVEQLGQKWNLISHHLPKYSSKQIRQRYLNYIRPNIVKDEFTIEEDRVICNYILKQGKHWRKLEDYLPGRTQGAIKCRYYGKLQKIIEQIKGLSL